MSYDILTISSILAIAVDLIIGILVFVNDRKSQTSIAFGFLNITLSAYLASNYFSIVTVPYEDKLFWVRMTMFFAVFLDTFLYLFIRFFPEKEVYLSKKENFFIAITTSVTAFITLTPFLFSGIEIPPGTNVPNPIVGPGMAIFLLSALYYIGGSIFIILKKFFQESDILRRKHLRSILFGAGITFTSFIVFNLFFTIVYKDAYFVNLTPLFTTVFIIFSGYAILRQGMFNVKIIATELLIFSLWFFILFRTLLSLSYEDQIMNGSLLLLLVVTGILDRKSVV